MSASPARVLWLSLATEISGAEYSLLELLRRTTLLPTVLAPSGQFTDRLIREGIPNVQVPDWRPSFHGGRRTWLTALPQLAALCLTIRREAHARHATRVAANGLRAGLALRLAAPGLPAVWAIRDVLPVGGVTRLARALSRNVHVVGNSRFIAAQCASRLHPSARSDFIYPGIAWGPAEPQLRRELDIGGAVPLVAVVGQITPWKRQRDAIFAMRGVRREIPDARLVIVGSAKFRAANREYADELAALAKQDAGKTVLLGERDDLSRIYPDLDLLLVPSEDEPFGRVAAEALGYGVPVIASNAGGLTEIIDDEAKGALIPVGDIAAWTRAIIGRLQGWCRVPGEQVAQVRHTFSADHAAARWDHVLAGSPPAATRAE